MRFTVGELRDGRETAYPDENTNRTRDDDLAAAFVSVQSVVIDPADQLWILDTGSPMFQSTRPGGPKLVCVDLISNRVVQNVVFPPDVALPTTYLNDVRFDLRRGSAGAAYITDSSSQGPNGIIVVDLASGRSWRRLHDNPSTKAERAGTFVPILEGRPFLEHGPDGSVTPASGMGADGIAISADGRRLFYCPLGSRGLYSVSTEALFDRTLHDGAVARTVLDEGDKAAPPTAWSRTPPAISMRPITSTTRCFAAEPTASGRPSFMIHACCGRIRCHWPPTAICTVLDRIPCSLLLSDPKVQLRGRRRCGAARQLEIDCPAPRRPYLAGSGV